VLGLHSTPSATQQLTLITKLQIVITFRAVFVRDRKFQPPHEMADAPNQDRNNWWLSVISNGRILPYFMTVTDIPFGARDENEIPLTNDPNKVTNTAVTIAQ